MSTLYVDISQAFEGKIRATRSLMQKCFNLPIPQGDVYSPWNQENVLVNAFQGFECIGITLKANIPIHLLQEFINSCPLPLTLMDEQNNWFSLERNPHETS